MADLAAPLRRRHGPRRGRVPDRRRRRRGPGRRGPRGDPRRRPTSRRRDAAIRPGRSSVKPASERDPRPAGGIAAAALDRARPDLGPVARAVARGHLPAGRRARRPRPREGRPMTADSTPLPAGSSSPADAVRGERPEGRRARRRPDDGAIPSRRERSVPHAGWMVVAGKEFADHLWSARFVVLLHRPRAGRPDPDVLRGRRDPDRGRRRSAAGRRSSCRCSRSPRRSATPGSRSRRASDFVAIVGPLLGIAFAFDAVNGERAEGTLPRLLSQPIYRDDVINGKFAAGLAVIGLVLTFIVAVIAAFGIIRLGIVAERRGGPPARRLAARHVRSTSRSGWRSGCSCRSSSGGPRRPPWSASGCGCCSRSSAA